MNGMREVREHVYAQGGEDWEGVEKEEDQLGEESEQLDEDITANILKSGRIASLVTWLREAAKKSSSQRGPTTKA